MRAFSDLSICEKISPTDATFFLANVNDAPKVYDYLMHQGIIVRNRSHIALCHNALRITIGNAHENSALIAALRKYKA